MDSLAGLQSQHDKANEHSQIAKKVFRQIPLEVTEVGFDEVVWVFAGVRGLQVFVNFSRFLDHVLRLRGGIFCALVAEQDSAFLLTKNARETVVVSLHDPWLGSEELPQLQ